MSSNTPFNPDPVYIIDDPFSDGPNATMTIPAIVDCTANDESHGRNMDSSRNMGSSDAEWLRMISFRPMGSSRRMVTTGGTGPIADENSGSDSIHNDDEQYGTANLPDVLSITDEHGNSTIAHGGDQIGMECGNVESGHDDNYDHSDGTDNDKSGGVSVKFEACESNHEDDHKHEKGDDVEKSDGDVNEKSGGDDKDGDDKDGANMDGDNKKYNLPLLPKTPMGQFEHTKSCQNSSMVHHARLSPSNMGISRGLHEKCMLAFRLLQYCYCLFKSENYTLTEPTDASEREGSSNTPSILGNVQNRQWGSSNTPSILGNVQNRQWRIRERKRSASLGPLLNRPSPAFGDARSFTNGSLVRGSPFEATIRKSGPAFSSESWRTPSQSRSTAGSDGLEWRRSAAPNGEGMASADQNESSNLGAELRSEEEKPITVDNAQQLCTPTACIFVANLLYTADDDVLQYRLGQIFNEFGQCWIKVVRDPRGMPLGFVQYETESNAKRALNLGNGIKAFGRETRCERAHGNRLYHVTSIEDVPLSEEQLRGTLRQLGPLKQVWDCTQVRSSMYQSGWIIKVISADRVASVVDANSLLGERQIVRVLPVDSEDALRNAPLSTPTCENSAHGSKVIFVGGTPETWGIRDIRGFFERFGAITRVDLKVAKSEFKGAPDNRFAFVEFLEASSSVKALGKDGQIIGNSRLRVRPRNPNHKTKSSPLREQPSLMERVQELEEREGSSDDKTKTMATYEVTPNPNCSSDSHGMMNSPVPQPFMFPQSGPVGGLVYYNHHYPSPNMQQGGPAQSPVYPQGDRGVGCEMPETTTERPTTKASLSTLYEVDEDAQDDM